MKYDLVRPCPKCPFRTDIGGYLRPERAIEIAHALARGAEFACHQTTSPDPEGEDLIATEDSQFCAGALLMFENQNSPNQIMRVAERIGLYHPERLDRSAPVVRSAFDFVRVHGGEEKECCSIVDAGCEAPAGMLLDGIAVPVEAIGDTHSCPLCGEAVCDNCSNDEGVCNVCVSYDDD